MYGFITPTGKNLGEENVPHLGMKKGKDPLITKITTAKSIWRRPDSELERKKVWRFKYQ